MANPRKPTPRSGTRGTPATSARSQPEIKPKTFAELGDEPPIGRVTTRARSQPRIKPK